MPHANFLSAACGGGFHDAGFQRASQFGRYRGNRVHLDHGYCDGVLSSVKDRSDDPASVSDVRFHQRGVGGKLTGHADAILVDVELEFPQLGIGAVGTRREGELEFSGLTRYAIDVLLGAHGQDTRKRNHNGPHVQDVFRLGFFVYVGHCFFPLFCVWVFSKAVVDGSADCLQLAAAPLGPRLGHSRQPWWFGSPVDWAQP